jgi:putative glutamate/gamma-aminobutyrate antiporter
MRPGRPIVLAAQSCGRPNHKEARYMATSKISPAAPTTAPPASGGAAPQGGKPATAKKAAVIGMMAFAIMNFTTLVSLRGLPSMAEYGLTSIFYFVFAAVVFLIPTSLVAAELAATFPKQGGVFRWVSEAFGPRWGFAALYYQWQAIVIWFPTVLIYGSVALAYIFWPESFDKALAANKLYTIAVVLAVYWFVTLFTFRGVGASARLSSLGGLFGTIIPGGILIILAGIYVAMGKPIQLPMHTGFLPDFSKFQNMVLAAGVFLYYAGMEIQAVHIKNLPNPTRNYPLSVLIAAVMVVVIFILGTLAVGIVIPQKDINLNQSLLIAYRDLWSALSLPWLGNVMALMLVAGVLGQASALVGGISTGLFTVGKAGYLPRGLQKANTHAMPVRILLLQGGVISLLCVVFAVVPSVQSTYQLLSQMATIIYLVMYLIMFVAAIRLRYTQPLKRRPFRIPGGNPGMWAVAVLGLLGSLVAMTLSFVPPKQISTGSPAIYVGILLVGAVVFVAIPFILFSFHKPAWKAADSDFEPFDWQTEGRKPSQVSKSPPTPPARPPVPPVTGAPAPATARIPGAA